MKLAAAAAIAGVIDPLDLRADHIVPSVFDRRVAPAVAEAVSRVAIESGFACGEQLSQFVAYSP